MELGTDGKNLIGDIQTPYGDYPFAALAGFCWGVWFSAVVLSFILSLIKWEKPL
jgi:hypothetical protein